LRGIQNNNRGVKSFTDERLSDSYNSFVTSLSDLPFSPEVHYNLGRTFFENKEYEKAYKESMTAAKFAEPNSETRFQALFQAGAALGESKKVDEAIAVYQLALEIKPESKEVKTNIELLTQQQQGGGQGDQQQEQKQDGEGQGDQQKDQPNQGPKQDQKKQPKPFKSDDLSKKDVENILDELERQEEGIRAKFQREGSKDTPKDKDW
jgi:Ca-activated chloride channel homolog